MQNCKKLFSLCSRCRSFVKMNQYGCFSRSLQTTQSETRVCHYEILGLRPNASPTEIRAAFVTLSKEVHPDRNPDDPMNHTNFIKLSESYSILSKPQSRREYDLSISQRIYKEHAARTIYKSHTTGDSNAPGSGMSNSTDSSDERESDRRIFWDETIWEMRDKSKDAQYSNHNPKNDFFYATNKVAILECFFIVVAGSLLFLYSLKISSDNQRAALEKTKHNMEQLHQARSKAKENGNEKQIELLIQKIEQRARRRQKREELYADDDV